jgi:hypothetical protein
VIRAVYARRAVCIADAADMIDIVDAADMIDTADMIDAGGWVCGVVVYDLSLLSYVSVYALFLFCRVFCFVLSVFVLDDLEPAGSSPALTAMGRQAAALSLSFMRQDMHNLNDDSDFLFSVVLFFRSE